MMDSNDLISFLGSSPDCFHAVQSVKEILDGNGYVELAESEPWQLEDGGRYYVVRNQASIIAFRYHSGFRGFMIAASHSDSPALKIKENPEISADGYTKLNVEKYGGAILSGWLDRPLSVSGRILVKENGRIVSRLVQLDEDLLVIPSLAIHMNRNTNDQQSWNVQQDLLPVLSLQEKTDFLSLIAQRTGTDKENILGHDLFLYVHETGRVIGAEKDMILAPHLDDLQCGFGNLHGFLEAEDSSDHIPVLAIFDNEETGSLSAQGADSTFLKDTLDNISAAAGFSASAERCALAGSFMVSADNAHAVHPNHPEKADPVNRPHINGGIVIKYNANQHYTSDGVSAAVFKEICRRADVPYQTFTNRSDMAGGSTLGNLSNRHVSLHTVDIGLAQLAMHSCMETAGVKDTEYLIRAMKVFFSSSFAEKGNSFLI